jgi:hypothetical protein
MRNLSYFTPALALAACAALAFAVGSATEAALHGCAHCGREESCQKICRLVCEEKKVNVVCWGSKCEDFCLPGHSHRDSKHCEDVCEVEKCNEEEVCSKPRPFIWYDWIPGCSKGIATKKKLMKKTVVKTVPSYRWVVEDLCAQCLRQCEDAPPPAAGAPIPPPPVSGAKVVYGRRE